ncbi:MAG TPA: lactonase family protein [Candidatus Acidoferrum sp.]|jgi:6-phosphogluconolactonase
MKITRIYFLLFAILFLFTLPISAQSPSHKYFVYVGTYTNKTESKGIYLYEFSSDTGKLTPKGMAALAVDPSWVAVHPNGKFLYAANESGKTSAVSAYSIDPKSGKLKLLNQLPSQGEDPCHLSFDETGKYLLVANYTSGTVAVFPILPDGHLGEHTAVVKDAGTLGPNKERQEAPHAHWSAVSSHNHFVYVSDLGLDRVLIYKFDDTNGTLTTGEPADHFSAVLSPGTGPRHAAFAPGGKFMYVLAEMKSSVTVFANDNQEVFRSVQEISALPKDFTGRNDAAEIAIDPSGKFLYTSNRGHDSIAIFAMDPAEGTLSPLAIVPTGGKEPRHFAIDPTGHYLLAENQNSNTISEFRIDPATGNLTPTGTVTQVPSPVCIAFLPIK